MTEDQQDRFTGNSFFRFGLIVTGKGEEDHITNLFRALMRYRNNTFTVIRRIGQRNPITSPDRTLEMVGCGKKITDRDEEQIGVPARQFIRQNPDSFVIVLDDLEYDRADQHEAVFKRYKAALNNLLGEQSGRASVHFLVMMLEAYFWAHADAMNAVFDAHLEDHEGDVEEIRNPKSKIKLGPCPNYDEVEHSGAILAQLDVEHVL